MNQRNTGWLRHPRLNIRLALCVAIVSALYACAGAATPSPAPSVPPATNVPPTSTVVPTRVGPTPTPTLAPNQFVNPVLNVDFPDPDVLQVGETYYAYATNSGPTNIQMAKSNDLVKWQYLGGALPALPLWAKPQAGLTWAPEVTTSADGTTYLMYYTTRDQVSDKQCIGVATSDSPEGPFRSTGAANESAFICQPKEGGSIDAASFADEDGSRYVMWKNDGNCCGLTTWIYIQKVSPDGLTLEGEPTRLIKNDQGWEGNLVEGPTLWKNDGKYYLFYSANNYLSERYAIGYAAADNVMGPYTKADRPLLRTDLKTAVPFGPGGQDVVRDQEGDTWLVYHSWEPTLSARWMLIDPLVWEDGKPVVKPAHKSPQPKP